MPANRTCCDKQTIVLKQENPGQVNDRGFVYTGKATFLNIRLLTCV